MAHPTVDYEPLTYTQGVRMADKVTWIRTSEAAVILNVKSTQGVLFLIRPDGNWIVRNWNAGTESMPRYYVAKEDIEALAKKRKSQTDL